MFVTINLNAITLLYIQYTTVCLSIITFIIITIFILYIYTEVLLVRLQTAMQAKYTSGTNFAYGECF